MALIPEILKNADINAFYNILPIIHPKTVAHLSLSVNHMPIYVGGRYLKFRRDISNSKWLYGGERIAKHSVEELLVNRIKEYFRCDDYRFYSSGREDIDALMLGNGRPFYFELLNPKTIEIPPKSLDHIQSLINEDNTGVGVMHLAVISRGDTAILKEAASTKNKSYRVLVEASRPIRVVDMEELSSIKNIELNQRTPTRIPGRADLIRKKMVLSLKAFPENPFIEGETRLFRAELTTTAGTYVKEFFSGDDGRTYPSVRSLLNCDYATVKELDVIDVSLNWP